MAQFTSAARRLAAPGAASTREWAQATSRAAYELTALTSSSTPVAVGGITNATAITAGPAHTCALLAGGGIDC